MSQITVLSVKFISSTVFVGMMRILAREKVAGIPMDLASLGIKDISPARSHN
jgi:hypothetical protein